MGSVTPLEMVSPAWAGAGRASFQLFSYLTNELGFPLAQPISMGKMGTGQKTAHHDCGLEGGKNRASALSIDFAQGKKSQDTPCLLAISKPGQGDHTSSSVLSLNNCISFGGTSFQEKVSSLGFCSDSFLSLGNLSESHLVNGCNWTTFFVAHFY